MASPLPVLHPLAAEHAAEIVGLEDSELRKLRSLYERARIELFGRLSQIGGEKFEAQQARLALVQIEAGLRTFTTGLTEAQKAGLEAKLQASSTQLLQEISVFEPGFRAAQGRIQTRAVKALLPHRALLLNRFQSSVQNYGLSTISEIQNRLAVHLIKKSPIREVALDIAGKLATSGFQGARWRAERIVRTELIHALSVARQESLKASLILLPDLQRQYNAILDARTSSLCQGLHGQIRDLDKPFSGGGKEIAHPPAHPNCRSSVLPYRKAWDEFEKTGTTAPVAKPGPTKAEIAAAKMAKIAEAKAEVAKAKEATLALYSLSAKQFSAGIGGKLEELSGAAKRLRILAGDDAIDLTAEIAALSKAGQALRAAELSKLEAIADAAKLAAKQEALDAGVFKVQTPAAVAMDKAIKDVGEFRGMLPGWASEQAATARTAIHNAVVVKTAQLDSLVTAAVADLKDAAVTQGKLDLEGPEWAKLSEATKAWAKFADPENPTKKIGEQYSLAKAYAKEGIAGKKAALLLDLEAKEAALDAALAAGEVPLVPAKSMHSPIVKAYRSAAREYLLYAPEKPTTLIGVDKKIQGIVGDKLKATAAAQQAAEAKAAAATAKAVAEKEAETTAFLGKIASEKADPWKGKQTGAPANIQLPSGKLAKKVQGSSGSNPGGWYLADGETAPVFVKFPGAVDQISAEAATAELARAMGLPTKSYEVFQSGKSYAIASPKVNLTQVGKKALSDWKNQDELTDHFIHAAWTRNWDAVGLGADNLVVVDGELMTIDYGGSLLWRAQGALKDDGMGPPGGVVEELTTMRSGSASHEATSQGGAWEVFYKLSDEQVAKRIQQTLGMLSKNEIATAVGGYRFAPALAEKIADSLEARRQWLLSWASNKIGAPGPITKASAKIEKAKASPPAKASTPAETVKALLAPLKGAKNPISSSDYGAPWAKIDALAGSGTATSADAALIAKMGRRLWAGVADKGVPKDQMLALRLMQAAYQIDPNATKAELGKFAEAMQDVLATLEKSKLSTDVEGLIAAVKAAEDSRKLAAAQAAAKAAQEAAAAAVKAKKLAEESAAKSAAAKAAYQAEKATYDAWAEKLPKKLTGDGAITAAYEKRLKSYLDTLAGDGESVTDIRLAWNAYREALALDPDEDPRLSLRQAQKKRKAQIQAAAGDIIRLTESAAVKRGIIPKPPRAPGGLPAPSSFAKSHYAQQGWDDLAKKAIPGNWMAGKKGIVRFTGSPFREMRAAQRGRREYPQGGRMVKMSEDEFLAHKRAADEAQALLVQMPGFETSPSTPAVYRREGWFNERARQDWIRDLPNQTHLTWHSLTSTTTSSSYGDILFRIRGRMSGTSVKGISLHSGEDEVLFPAGARFRIEKVQWNGDQSSVVIDMVEEFSDE